MKTANGSLPRAALCVLWLSSVLTVLVRAHGSKESLAGGTKYDNHLNASQAFLEPDMISVSRYDSSADGVHSDGADSPFGNHQHHHHHHHQFSCQACQYRNVYAMASLKSIKAHFLMKLGIEYTPNRTRYPEVPERILNSFHDKLAHRQSSPASQLKDSFDYQGDEPSSMQADEPEEAEDDYDYYQITNKIFILPNQNVSNNGKDRRLRVESKAYLQFQMETRDYTSDIYARMLVYVHGEDWWKQNGGEPIAPLKAGQDSVSFTVGKGVKGSAIVGRYHGPIPKGEGRFIEFNVTSMVLEWFAERDQLMGGPRTNKYVVLETFNELSRKLVVDHPNGGKFTPYIEIEFRDAPKKRIKRNLSLNCDENANETRCCRYPLTVDFEKFGWDWIIAPKRYEASYCAGECMMTFLPKYEHTHVMQLSTSAIPCCSPKKMRPIKLLYFDLSYNVIYSTIPNMVVEKCSCS